MVISWLGSLVVLLNRFWKSLFRVEHIEESYNETVKRLFLWLLFCLTLCGDLHRTYKVRQLSICSSSSLYVSLASITLLPIRLILL